MDALFQQFKDNLVLALTDANVWIVILDVVLVYYLIYRGLLFLKGTKAVRMLLGLLLLVVFYFFARYFRLQTFSWLLDQFFNSFIIVILILFQDDIRRGLSRVGIDIVGGRERLSKEELAGLEELVKAISTLSGKKIGALVVWEREASVFDYIQEGTQLDANIAEELLFSIFLPYSPLHDGAVVIQQGRVARAACFLPLTQNPAISKHLGTRHRAAIGLTEMTDALVVVVSETDGRISLCKDGTIQRNHDAASLYNALLSILDPRFAETKRAQMGGKDDGGTPAKRELREGETTDISSAKLTQGQKTETSNSKPTQG